MAEAARGGALVGEEVPGEEEAKLGLNNCRRMRGSYWSNGIGRRKGGGTSSTAAEAYRRRGERRRGSSGGGPASVSGW
jgi:hypothetical protein